LLSRHFSITSIGVLLMSYLVLARKYRPATFDTVNGQEHVTRTLMNAIKRNKVGHAFIFTGPRGVGKTSVARIFARGLNCKEGPTHNPCLKCVNCNEIGSGISMAVREIDGASHNSVDNVRELIESFRSPPAPGYRYKVYIIDEVHMLSIAAFNALLKSLEEPPPFTIFILATTEVHKIPQTVISRCQRHDFRSLPIDVISGRLTEICKSEKVKIDEEAVRMLARLADGSMRDSQSLLERVQSYTDEKITASDVATVLGIVERGILMQLIAAIVNRDAAEALNILSAALSSGLDIGIFLKEFVTVWRELLIVQTLKEKGAEALGVLDGHRVQLQEIAQSIDTLDLQDLVQLAREGADSALRSSYPKYVLEALIVRLATREPMAQLSQLNSNTSGRGPVGGGGSSGTRVNSPAAQNTRVSTEGALRTTDATSLHQNTVKQASAPVSAPMEASASQFVGPQSWENFVEYVNKHQSKIFAEQLKRLFVACFEPGVLTARGPDFTVNYLQRKDCVEQLKKALTSFAQVDTWLIKLERSDKIAGVEPGSIAHEKRNSQQQLVETRREDLVNHPVVKSLQKLFPGTQIENIKVMED
jgi:DNA polymerase-3 subunit gamma/tau